MQVNCVAKCHIVAQPVAFEVTTSQRGAAAACDVQAGEPVSDEVQNQLMVLAIEDVARLISAQTPANSAAAAAGGKPAAKPAASKAKKDEPKAVQVHSC